MLTQIKTCPPGQRKESSDGNVIAASALNAQSQPGAQPADAPTLLMQSDAGFNASAARSLQ